MDYQTMKWIIREDLVAASVKFVCSIIPNNLVSPFGVGVKFKLFHKLCNWGVTAANKGADLVSSYNNYNFQRKHNRAWLADCTTKGEGMARLFCDVHCVRDAVLRSEKNLRRVVHRATKLTNKNLQAFAQWNQEYMMGQTNFL